MRLGLLIYNSLETLSGGYLYDRQLVDYFRRQGDAVDIVALPWRNYLRHMGDNLSASLLQRLNRMKVDLLLQDELNHPSLFALNWKLRKSADFPLVGIVHHLRSNEARQAWQNWFFRTIERSYLASLDGFIFNSQTTHRSVERLLGYSKPWVVAYPGGDRLEPAISDQEIAARVEQSGPLKLLFLGNLIRRKGLHVLLEALRLVPGEQMVLAVAGRMDAEPAYTQAIQRQVQDSGLASRVEFLGPLDNARIARRMKDSHLLAVPSSYEGFGIAYLEGMGFGLPAIGTTAGAAGEIITSGVDGYLIPPGDAKTLARTLQELATDRDRLLEMSLAARRHYLKQPTWEQSAENVHGFLQSLAGKQREH